MLTVTFLSPTLPCLTRLRILLFRHLFAYRLLGRRTRYADRRLIYAPAVVKYLMSLTLDPVNSHLCILLRKLFIESQVNTSGGVREKSRINLGNWPQIGSTCINGEVTYALVALI